MGKRLAKGREYLKINVEDVVFRSPYSTRDTPKILESSKKSGLYDDIAKNGVKDAIVVEWSEKERKWMMVDGHHRFVCAQQLGIKVLRARLLGWQEEPDDFEQCPYCWWSGSPDNLEFHMENHPKRR